MMQPLEERGVPQDAGPERQTENHHPKDLRIGFAAHLYSILPSCHTNCNGTPYGAGIVSLASVLDTRTWLPAESMPRLQEPVPLP